MSQTNLFDDVASIMKDFAGTSRSQELLQNYNFQLGAVCQLIKHTHSIVADKLEGIAEASSLEEARSLVGQLENDPLTESFRAKGLCDIFEGFGRSLRNIVAPRHGETKPPLSSEQERLWFKFCNSLESREQQVAILYADQIQEIGKLVYAANTEQELDNIQAEAKKARNVLTSQMAELDSLAGEFQLLLREHTSYGR